jgi:hypothetical protein
MNDIIDLAHGTINGDAELSVQLIRPTDMPASERTLKPTVVRILWPPQPTIVDPNLFPDVAAAVVKMFSEAHIALAAIKVRKRPL